MKISELNTTNLLCADTKFLVSNQFQNNYVTTLLKYNTLSNSINNNIQAIHDIEKLKEINNYIDDIKKLNILDDNITVLQQHLAVINECINNIGLSTLEGTSIKKYIDDTVETKYNEIKELLTDVNTDLDEFKVEITNTVKMLNLSADAIQISASDILNSDLLGISNKINTISGNLYTGWESEDIVDDAGEIIPGSNQLSLYLLHKKTSHIYDFMFGTDDTDVVNDNMTTSIDQHLQQQISTNIDIITDNIFQIEQFTTSQTISNAQRKYINIKLNTNRTFNATYSPIYITSIDINPDTNIKVLCAYINQADNSVGISLINTNSTKAITCSITINVLYAKI